MPDALRRLITLISAIVPSASRREFRDEWHAELAVTPSLRRALGAVPDAWWLFRQQWSLDMLMQDVRYALRLMRQRPGYTSLVVITLATGIGAATAMFSVLHAVLLRPLPFKDPSRLVMIWEDDRLNHKPRSPVAPANFDDWRTQGRAVEPLAAWVGQTGAMKAGGDPFPAQVAVVTTNFLGTLGATPLLGRDFTPDDLPPAARVLMLSHAAWMTHFGGDRNILDRTVLLAGQDYRVVGVMPPGFDLPDRTIDAWRPMAGGPGFFTTRAQHFLSVVGRLRPGVTFAQAAQDLERVAVSAQHTHPQTNQQRGTTMVGLQEAIVGDVRSPMYYLAAAVALLLLIGCANAANLMLAQASTRRREMAVRAAMGAGRGRLVHQLLVEGILLALVSGALGLALAWQGTRLVARLAVDYVPRVAAARVDPTMLAFAAALSIATGVLFTLLPALRASRPDVQHDLREGARGSTSGGRWMRDALVVAEFAAAVVLVAGGALLFASFRRVLHVDPGFTTSQVVSMDPELPQQRYQNGAAIAQFYTDLAARLAVVPGIRAMSPASNVPLTGIAWTSWLTIEHRPRTSGEPPEVGYRSAGPGYLQVMRIPLLKGRWIADSDSAGAAPVIVVNKTLADRYFPDGDAVGSRIRLGPNPKAPWRTIVGVIGDVRHLGPESDALPEAYFAFAQDPLEASMVVRGDLDRAALVSTVRRAAASIDPEVVIARVQWLDTLLDDHLAPRRLAMLLVEGFAFVALGLALFGLYGVVTYTVAQRIPEIGVRIALGAEPGAIQRMVLGQGLRLAVPGLIAGVALALAAARLARSVLFQVSPADPATFAMVIAAVLAVAAVACVLPARRAARVDPLVAIRAE